MISEKEEPGDYKEITVLYTYRIYLWVISLCIGTAMLMMSCDTAASTSVPSAPGSMDSTVVRKLYMAKCAICHGEDGKLGYANSKDLTVSILSREEVIAMIRYGKTTMPPQDMLSDEQIAALAEFAMKLRKP